MNSTLYQNENYDSDHVWSCVCFSRIRSVGGPDHSVEGEFGLVIAVKQER